MERELNHPRITPIDPRWVNNYFHTPCIIHTHIVYICVSPDWISNKKKKNSECIARVNNNQGVLFAIDRCHIYWTTPMYGIHIRVLHSNNFWWISECCECCKWKWYFVMTQPKHHSICHNNTRIYNYHIYTYNIYHSIEVLQKTDNDELIVNTYDARCSLVMRVQRPNSLAMLGRMGHFSLVKHCIY